jgi:hypothetical protein
MLLVSFKELTLPVIDDFWMLVYEVSLVDDLEHSEAAAELLEYRIGGRIFRVPRFKETADCGEFWTINRFFQFFVFVPKCVE